MSYLKKIDLTITFINSKIIVINKNLRSDKKFTGFYQTEEGLKAKAFGREFTAGFYIAMVLGVIVLILIVFFLISFFRMARKRKT